MPEERLTNIFSSSWKALAIVLPLLVVLLLVAPGWSAILPVAILLILIPVIALNSELAFFLILALRPSIDIFGEWYLFHIRQIPFNLSSVVSLLVILWAGWRLLSTRSLFWRRPFFWGIFILLLVSLPGFAVTESLGVTVKEFVRLTSIFLLYLVAFDLLTTEAKIKKFTKTIALSVVIPVLVGIVQFVFQGGLDVGSLENRVFGTFGHPNVFAFYLVLTITVLLTTLPIFGDVWRKRMIVGFAVLFGLLVATYTRGAWIGMAIILLLFGAFFYRKILFTVLGIGLATVLLFPIINTVTFSVLNVNLLDVPVIGRIANWNTEDSSLDWRVKLWTEMRRKVSEQPYFGHGLGTFPVLRQLQINNPAEATEAHNDYLRLAIETGFVGLAWYILFLLSVLVTAIHRVVRNIATIPRRFAVGFLGLALAYVFMSYFDNLLQATAVMWAYWATFAAFLTVTTRQQISVSENKKRARARRIEMAQGVNEQGEK